MPTLDTVESTQKSFLIFFGKPKTSFLVNKEKKGKTFENSGKIHRQSFSLNATPVCNSMLKAKGQSNILSCREREDKARGVLKKKTVSQGFGTNWSISCKQSYRNRKLIH